MLIDFWVPNGWIGHLQKNINKRSQRIWGESRVNKKGSEVRVNEMQITQVGERAESSNETFKR